MKKFALSIFILVAIITGFGVYTLLNNKNTIVSETPKSNNITNQTKKEETDMNQTTVEPTSTVINKTNLPKPEMLLVQGKIYTATLTTSLGNITIQLNADKTPITVNNFVYLARQSFYNNVIFHRVISGFMIQGGDPLGNGRGGPGYQFNDEKFEGSYSRGTVAMANAGPNTNGSQFFIMHQDYPLPTDYVIFGKVISGMDVVDKIATTPTGANDRPVTSVVIQKVEIVEK